MVTVPHSSTHTPTLALVSSETLAFYLLYPSHQPFSKVGDS